MKKSRIIAVILLGAFLGISSMPLLAAPAAPVVDNTRTYLIFFQNDEEHGDQWLIRSLSDSEELNNRTAADQTRTVATLCVADYQAKKFHLRLTQQVGRRAANLPKVRLYLVNSLLLI